VIMNDRHEYNTITTIVIGNRICCVYNLINYYTPDEIFMSK